VIPLRLGYLRSPRAIDSRPDLGSNRVNVYSARQ
jgi:hypothetical protein